MFSCRVSHVFPLVGILFLGLPALPRSHRNLCLCGVTSESLIFFSLSYRLLLSSPHPLSWINSPIHWWFITSSLMVFLYIDWTRPIAKKTRAFIIHEVVCKNEVPVLTSCVLYCVNMSLFVCCSLPGGKHHPQCRKGGTGRKMQMTPWLVLPLWAMTSASQRDVVKNARNFVLSSGWVRMWFGSVYHYHYQAGVGELINVIFIR